MDRIRNWIENNGVRCYEIHSVGNKEKVAERDCADTTEAINEFEKDYTILSDGKYFIKGMKNPKGDRGQVRLDFQIGIINNTTHMGGLSIEQIKQDAYNQAKQDFEFQALMREFAEMKQTMKIIIQIIKEKFDDDEDNDEHATKLLDTISNVKENFEGAKDLFKDLKF